MSTRDLINAIAAGDAIEIENAFNSVMAEKVSARIDDMRIDVAQNLFAEEIEEEYELNLEDYSLEEIEAYMQTEEFEQLDELSKDTLMSYADSNISQQRKLKKIGDKEKLTKRAKGLGLAYSKLNKEEVEEIEEEQLDELSIQTMKSARDKLGSKAVAAHYDDNKTAARNLANRALKIGRKVDRKEWERVNQKRLDQTAKYQKEQTEQ